MQKEIEKKCPDCQYGSLQKMTDDEKKRASQKLGDKLEGTYYGCDECSFMTDEDCIEDYPDFKR